MFVFNAKSMQHPGGCVMQGKESGVLRDSHVEERSNIPLEVPGWELCPECRARGMSGKRSWYKGSNGSTSISPCLVGDFPQEEAWHFPEQGWTSTQKGGRYCGIESNTSTCQTSVLYECQFVFQLFTSDPANVSGKSSQEWPKCLGPCHLCGSPRRGSWFLASA